MHLVFFSFVELFLRGANIIGLEHPILGVGTNRLL